MKSVILHIDMDAFFASVEQRDQKEWQGKPVVVGGPAEKRGVVSAASYEARKFGVHSAMAMYEAIARCPDCIIVPVNMAKYQQVSKQIMEIFHQYTPEVEALSLDEAFLDVSGSQRLFGSGIEIGWKIKEQIQQQLHLTASVGVASNKFLAKLASDMDKPDGMYVIEDGDIAQKVWPLPVKRMMGVGGKTEEILAQLHIKTIGDLARMDAGFLQGVLGKQGKLIHELANGIDQRPVISYRVHKSMGRETTFEKDTLDLVYLEGVLFDLTEEVCQNLRKAKLKGKTVTLKIKYADFKSITRAVTLPQYSANFDVVFQQIKGLLNENYHQEKPVRLIGLSVSHLENEQDIVEQINLFTTPKDEKKKQLDYVLDQLNLKYGDKAITRARHLDLPH